MAPYEAVIVPIQKGDSSDVMTAARRTLRRSARGGPAREARRPRSASRQQIRRLGDARRSAAARTRRAGPRRRNRHGRAPRSRRKARRGRRSRCPSRRSPARFPPCSTRFKTNLFESARASCDAHTIVATDAAEFYRLLRSRAGMIDIPWCDRPACEAHVKAETSATTRTLHPLEAPATCVACGEPATVRAYFAQSY